ncbi:DUF2158 domain-containing protein [Caballeronia sp. TF1N1]|uniref:DUF2158 domain-containing protein n=1 Tax=Caballeronia sp. TF1N1 TaxID=2878153 RepID=UPI001FCFA329|nr:DUF2158 domain-containing protein [Caballeronia sp. TF1N1]
MTLNKNIEHDEAVALNELRVKFMGKTIRLKSGGPVMTVDSVSTVADANYLDCCWFDGVKLEQAKLRPDSIELAEQPRSHVELI